MDTFSIKYTIFFFGTLIFSLLINFIFLRFVRTLGIRNLNENAVRWSESDRPSIGGLGFYIIFLLSLSTYSIAFGGGDSVFNQREVGILFACTLAFIMGLADDAYNTKPVLKSSTQITCGLILVFSGTSIDVFDNQVLNNFLTILWVMGIMNSINMLDNMDGITGTVSLIICVTMLICMYAADEVNSFFLILITGLTSALLGFLYFNWWPSKMFMGDSGSQFLGSFLASMGIIFFWNLEPLSNTSPGVSMKFIVPLLAFLIPIADTTTVVINRLSKGRSPFVGGKDHTTHSLARTGLRDVQVALLIAAVSLISGGLISFYYYNPRILATWERVILIVYLVLIFAGLFTITHLKKRGDQH
ncbi:MAG: MraY family glycosyltransferase [Vicingaceae bacterium]